MNGGHHQTIEDGYFTTHSSFELKLMSNAAQNEPKIHESISSSIGAKEKIMTVLINPLYMSMSSYTFEVVVVNFYIPPSTNALSIEMKKDSDIIISAYNKSGIKIRKYYVDEIYAFHGGRSTIVLPNDFIPKDGYIKIVHKKSTPRLFFFNNFYELHEFQEPITLF